MPDAFASSIAEINSGRHHSHGAKVMRVEDGFDIRTVQELMGHASVETTMVYTHVLNKGGRAVRSPLDALG